jgi:hypothetical protein
MIENWTYNINENHTYNNMESDYKIVYADDKVSPLYTIKSDERKTGSVFEITDSENFNQPTDYYHRLHVCQFPVGSTCFNGLKDGITQHTMRILADNTATVINTVSVGFRLSNSTGTENYRYPVEYLNGIQVVLSKGGTTIDTKTTQQIGPTATDLLNGYVIFKDVALDNTNQYRIEFTYSGNTYDVDFLVADINGYFQEVMIDTL